jgi:putative ABC transport system ATP-binding protein
MSPVLQIEQLRFGYGRGTDLLDVPALRLDARQRLFLFGPSGSGKSTLLNLIAGTLAPRAGRIALGEIELSRLPGWRRDRLRSDRIGFVFQQFNLLPFVSVLENVLLPCRFSRRRRARAAEVDGSAEASAQRLLAALGLRDPALANRRAGELSVGQQQRVAAARALIGRPELVMADEPTSALDADSRDEFLDLLFAEVAAAGSALLFVSHDRSLAHRFDAELSLPSINRAGVPA